MCEANKKNNFDICENLQKDKWLCILVFFFTDITEHMKNLNLKLHGMQQNICQPMSHVEASRNQTEFFWRKYKMKIKYKIFTCGEEIKSDFDNFNFKVCSMYD